MVQAGSVEQANTVGLFLTDSDGYDNTAGLDFKPIVMAQPTLLARAMNR